MKRWIFRRHSAVLSPRPLRHAGPLILHAAVVASALLCAHVAQAQTTVAPGTRVRVTTLCPGAERTPVDPDAPACALVGAALRIEGSSLTLALNDSTARIGLDAIRRLEASEGRRTYRLPGAGAGLVLGAVGTWLILHQGGSTSLCDRSANQDAMRAGECAALSALGGLAGAGIGAIVGGLFGSERWRDVPPNALRIGWRPGGEGRIGVRLAR